MEDGLLNWFYRGVDGYVSRERARKGEGRERRMTYPDFAVSAGNT